MYKLFFEQIKIQAKSIFQDLQNARTPSIFFDTETSDFDYLKSDNWGGEGENRISQKTIDNLHKLIEYIPYYRGICPGHNGTIGIVYSDIKSYMYIEIKENKSSFYFEEDGVEICEEDLEYKTMLSKADSFWKKNMTYFSQKIEINNQPAVYQECFC